MFKRKIQKQLEEWAQKDNRKPLVLRGARQVGKNHCYQAIRLIV